MAKLPLAVLLHDVGRNGNRDPEMAPHGTYPAEGEDRWIAIAVANDEQWRALCDGMGQPELADVPRFRDAETRLAHADELDEILTKWTRERSAEAIEKELQARGVPAHTVLDSAGFANDSQLLHRNHFSCLERSGLPTMTIEDARSRLSRTPARVDRDAAQRGPRGAFGETSQHEDRALKLGSRLTSEYGRYLKPLRGARGGSHTGPSLFRSSVPG